MSFSALPCYLVPLRRKYSPLHPLLKHPQPTFLPQCERPSFTPIQNNRQNIVLYILIFVFSKRVQEFVIHNFMCYYFKLQLNPCKHSFIEFKYTLGIIFALSSSQHQVCAVYFDLAWASALVLMLFLSLDLACFGFPVVL